jgi:diaminohydroxyphosphoribosylaminopyrimidine deaminase/5-amino-6-(5-phosphoribosylamino)uracil reductase
LNGRFDMDNLRTHFMQEALRLARKGLGKTSPNPMVGAVIVKKGAIVGGGWQQGKYEG